MRSLPGGRDAKTLDLEKFTSDFVEETEGLLLIDLNAIAQLVRNESLPLANLRCRPAVQGWCGGGPLAQA